MCDCPGAEIWLYRPGYAQEVSVLAAANPTAYAGFALVSGAVITASFDFPVHCDLVPEEVICEPIPLVPEEVIRAPVQPMPEEVIREPNQLVPEACPGSCLAKTDEKEEGRQDFIR